MLELSELFGGCNRMKFTENVCQVWEENCVIYGIVCCWIKKLEKWWICKSDYLYGIGKYYVNEIHLQGSEK